MGWLDVLNRRQYVYMFYFTIGIFKSVILNACSSRVFLSTHRVT